MTIDADNRIFRVRNMTRADLQHAYRWSVEEGWNIGKHDHDVFFATDPAGFFVGELDGKPIGSVSGVGYGDDYGFIGIYIVQNEFRGRGYGRPIFDRAMSYLANRCVGLDGVIAQQDNYRRSGFNLAYRNIRVGWKAPQNLTTAPGILHAADVPFDRLVEYDARHFFAPRAGFVSGWIRQPDATPLVAVEHDKIVGFGMVRPAVSGFLVGPLFADSTTIAENLFHALCSYHAGSEVFLDVPEINSAGVSMADRLGLTQIFETARMYTGAVPELPMDHIFGVTTFELG